MEQYRWVSFRLDSEEFELAKAVAKALGLGKGGASAIARASMISTIKEAIGDGLISEEGEVLQKASIKEEIKELL